MTQQAADRERSRTERTRNDVVTAAIDVWGGDNTASLGSVAEAAGVGRSTLNRYFAGRPQLVAAVDAECRERYIAAFGRSRPEQGPGLDALLRVCTELLQLGPVLAIVFADNALIDIDSWYAESEDPLAALVVRGLADGSIAADLPAEWIVTLVWTSLYAAHLVIVDGTCTQHEAAGLLVRCLGAAVTS